MKGFKVITLHHSTLTDDKGDPKAIQLVVGPGIVFYRNNNFPTTVVTTVGGAVIVLETEQEIAAKIAEKEGDKDGT